MNYQKYYAHTSPDPKEKAENEDSWQLLDNHLRETAELAKQFASSFNAEEWGYLAGLWHDAGKYSEDFQNVI